MTSEVFAAIKAELGISAKIAKRLGTMRHAPLLSAQCFVLWYRSVKLAGDKEKAKAWREKNKEKIKRQVHEHYLRNKAKVIERTKIRRMRPEVRQKAVEANRRWKLGNTEKYKAYTKARKESGASAAYHRKYTAERPGYSAEKTRRFRERKIAQMGREAFNAIERKKNAAYRAKNKEKTSRWKKEYAQRNATNPVFIIAKRLRTRLHDEIRFRHRKTVKHCSALDLCGCTREELAHWIESKFKKGMTWENRSEWHIDHILPVASFDMTNLEDQKRCFHYTNLRPLWKLENIRKGNRIIPFKPVHLEMFLELKQKAKA